MALLERLLGEDTLDEQVDLEERQHEADDTLNDRIDAAEYGIDTCAVTGIAVVNEGPGGEPIVVPIARFSLGEDVEEPDYDLVWELVSEGLHALQPALEGVFVRHYDIQFTFDGDELFEAEECRRVAVTPDLADTFVSDASFDTGVLRDAMLDADDIDDEIAPVAWGESKNYSSTANAAIVTNGAAMAAGTSAGAASCAGTGAAGAGAAGGTCGGAGGV
ncbi:hypothetical protein [Halococcus thailandensis]|uniref:Uncharacterized protein n=1 Tax=Halococcus thailandensis JCM 13552 TaxID=1227457 RepID=M0NHW5_9EURY|nr:hypothetical protein [Halococcus thailandensis]EMA56255.1 hypothetical protein C451_03304 [Halococcus thailandensis JCM 13552]